jgi:hypothetical protein
MTVRNDCPKVIPVNRVLLSKNNKGISVVVSTHKAAEALRAVSRDKAT